VKAKEYTSAPHLPYDPAALNAARACYLEGREARRRHTRLLLARLGARVQREIRTILAH
jgi:hypothetical protein